MTDFYLRTSTKSNMEACLLAAGIATRNASGDIMVQWDGGRVDIDFIGVIYNDGVVVDSGYHANLRVSGGDLTQNQLDELPILDPAPTTPMRVFA
jgi:hypothetical protein